MKWWRFAVHCEFSAAQNDKNVAFLSHDVLPVTSLCAKCCSKNGNMTCSSGENWRHRLCVSERHHQKAKTFNPLFLSLKFQVYCRDARWMLC